MCSAEFLPMSSGTSAMAAPRGGPFHLKGSPLSSMRFVTGWSGTQ